MENQSSRTAADVVLLRAVSSLAPKKKRIIVDRYARYFMPMPWAMLKLFFMVPMISPFTYIVGHFFMFLVMGYRGVSKSVAFRHRYIDDRLSSAYDRGIRQVIILGAGFDSRAHRLDYPGIKYVEIDHPYTQKKKNSILNKKSGKSYTINNDVQYIAVDFMDKDWSKQVIDSGIISKEPSFIIWEGVSYYLSREAVMYTLNTIKQFAANGSTLVFDAFPEDVLNEMTDNEYLLKTRKYVTRNGEPFLWACDRECIREMLADLGFTYVSTQSIHDILVQLKKSDGLQIDSFPLYNYLYLVEANF